METKNKSKFGIIVLVIIVILALGVLSYYSKDGIKKFFGFATVYNAFVYDTDGQAAVTNSWKISTNSYAWNENTGWIDFASSTGVATYVADNALWGYAYGENVGWISLNCNNADSCDYSYKVANNGEGKLSGYAWNENTGWIDFGTSTNMSSRTWGVSIDSSGEFTGYAYGENVGWISFNHLNGGYVDYKVSTNWRPVSSRSTGRRTAVKDPGTVIRPAQGDTWIVGIDYEISWKSFDEENNTLVYLSLADTDSMKLIGTISSSTVIESSNNSLVYKPVMADIKDVPASAKWKIFVCNGEANTARDNCGYSGNFYITTQSLDNTITSTTTTNPTSNPTTPKVLPPINAIELPVTVPEKVILKDLPVFGGSTGESSFTFVPQLTSFLFAPLPSQVENTLKESPKLKDYLKSLGLTKEQNFVSLIRNPLVLLPRTGNEIPGLFSISNGSTTLRTYLVNDLGNLAQSVRVASGTKLTISLTPTITGEITGLLNNSKTVYFSNNGNIAYANITLGSGRHVLKTSASPLPLIIEVLSPAPASQTTNSSTPWLYKVLDWLNL
ncbi:MAG: hypothetical protein NTU76_04430 [Candidatus Taylorbacteria bacterium]|nr:hypothetical protein [Candidatus Taylorbacteria bacterium]